jgi:hypothetical protein
LAIDNLGNIYICEQGNYCIRKINTNGIISTVVGNGVKGFSGDTGPATLAELDSPTGVAVDKNGNIYIADNGNCRIRKVNYSGIITTIAGSSICSYSGDGGPATNAELYSPYDVYIDSVSNLLGLVPRSSASPFVSLLGE